MNVKRPMPSHFGTAQPPAGTFKATCQIGSVGFDRLLEFDDHALFEEHMLAAHGAKPGQCIRPRDRKTGVALASPSWSAMRAKQQLRLGKGNWSPPKLTADGKAFEPTGLEPGATVTWKQGSAAAGGEVERSGQVWAPAWRTNSVWVIPFELFENEAAVMLEQLGSGRLDVYETAKRQTRRTEVPA